MTKIYAETLNYWKTSRSGADTWIEKAKKEIESVGGVIAASAHVEQGDKQGFMLAFCIGNEQFRLEWPVLPLQPKKRDEKQTEIDKKAARVQAATMLYHDCKHKAVMAKVFGARTAFVQFLVLTDGQTVGSLAQNDIQKLLPSSKPQLVSGS